MKSTIKLVLVAVLFSSTVFAEGDLGNGSRNCPTGTTCLTSTPSTEKEVTVETKDTVLDFVQKYLDSVFKYFEN